MKQEKLETYRELFKLLNKQKKEKEFFLKEVKKAKNKGEIYALARNVLYTDVVDHIEKEHNVSFSDDEIIVASFTDKLIDFVSYIIKKERKQNEQKPTY